MVIALVIINTEVKTFREGMPNNWKRVYERIDCGRAATWWIRENHNYMDEVIGHKYNLFF